MESSILLDAIIIGAGPAGLSTALTLARQRHTAVVFDSGSYRNELASHMHTVITWDHKDPKEFRSAARENILSRYNTIRFENLEIVTVSKVGDGTFLARDINSRDWNGKKLVLASGSLDIFPSIQGYAECWATGIFQCLFCHGYEEQNCDSAGVLAVGEMAFARPALHMARFVKQLVGNATVYTSGAEILAKEVLEGLKSGTPIKVDSRSIKSLEKRGKGAQVVIHFEDGSDKVEGFLAHKPKTRLKGSLAEQLDLELSPTGELKVNPPFNTTNIHGVFAAGDCSSQQKLVPAATLSGALVGAGVAAQIQGEI